MNWHGVLSGVGHNKTIKKEGGCNMRARRVLWFRPPKMKRQGNGQHKKSLPQEEQEAMDPFSKKVGRTGSVKWEKELNGSKKG